LQFMLIFRWEFVYFFFDYHMDCPFGSVVLLHS
jgi:hypothetical protein